MIIISCIAILLTLIVVIGLHELGHALSARWFRVKIERISLGFGKPLFNWQSRSGTDWTLARWPLGGYVRLANSRIAKVPKKEEEACFDKQPISAQAIILLAGGLMNFSLALLAFIFFFMLGFPSQLPVVQTVTPNSVMSKAGIIPGDQFLQINQTLTANWAEVAMNLATHLGGKNISLKVMNPSSGIRTLPLDLNHLNWNKKGNFLQQFGITDDKSQRFAMKVPGQPFFTALQDAFEKLTTLIGFFLTMIKQLITGQLPFFLLLGPLGFLSLSVQSFLQGFALFLNFLGTVSISVGLINLFPLPGLDGGSIFYLIIEKIRGKPLSIAVEVLLYRLATIGFFLFLVQLFLNDLNRSGTA